MTIKRIDYKVNGNDMIRFEIDNEAARAIRFICGYTQDLRVSLSGGVIRDTIFNMIKDNKYNLLGTDFSLREPSRDMFETWSDYWDKQNEYDMIIQRIVTQIMR